MVSPARLVETISDATGFPLASVVDIDRKLVTAGLRRKGGRGPYVAQMTALAAARLLTAILSSPQSTAAASAVQRYQATQVDAERSSPHLFGSAELDDLAALAPEHSFVDGLEGLIVSAAIGSLSKAISGSDRERAPHIEVYAFTGATRARIRISGLPNGRTASVQYTTAAGSYRENMAGDLEQSRRITGRTIYAVTALFGTERQDGGA